MENQQTPSIQPQISTLSSIGDLLKRAWEIYRARFWTFLGIVSFPLIVHFFLLSPLEALKIGPIFSILLELGSNFLSFWSTISLLFAIKDREEKIGILESYKRALPKIIPFIWILILTGFLTFGGLLLFIIPGIIFSVWFMFGEYVLVWEDKRGMDAILRSKQLVSGNFWKIVWRSVALVLISLVIFIISLPFLLISKVIEILNIPFLGIVGYLPTLFWIPLPTIFLFLIYDDLKKLKEGILFEPPKIETKVKYILIGVAGIIIGLLLIFGILFVKKIIPSIIAPPVPTPTSTPAVPSEVMAKARDAKRRSDMNEFQSAQEMYYDKMGKYYISGEREGLPAIPPYLPNALDDPLSPERHYKWLDNTSCPDYFCVYAILEDKGDCSENRYLVVWGNTTREICDIPPTNACSCW